MKGNCKYRKNFYTATEYLKKASNVSSIAKTAKQLMLDTSSPEKFDKNLDIVACCSGVIELRTGVLRKATYLTIFQELYQLDMQILTTQHQILTPCLRASSTMMRR